MPQRDSSKTIEIMTRQVLLLLPDASSPTDDTQILLPTADGGIVDSIVLLSIADRIIGDTSVQLLMEVLATTVITC